MLIWAIGIFFIIAGIMMWPFGHACLIVGGVICVAKFFSQYKSVENYQWMKTFNNSSLVDEFIQYIDDHHVHDIEIKPKYIAMDDYVIKFDSRGISDLTISNCLTLARTIKSKIKYGEIYELSPIVKHISSGGHDRPIGMRQTHNGNFVFDYGSDGPSQITIGYRLKVELTKKETKKTSTRSEWK